MDASMTEDVAAILGNGFYIWKKNLGLCVPFLLHVILVLILLVPFAISILAILGVFENPNALEDMSGAEMMQALGDALPELIAAGCVFIIVSSLISSFFTAGAVGMAGEANASGRTSSSTMWRSGREGFFRIFIASLVISVISLVVAIIVSVAFVGYLSRTADPAVIGNLTSLSETGLMAAMLDVIWLVLVWFLLILIFLLAISLVFSVVSQAVVLEGMGPIQALKSSIQFFRGNMFDVFLIWLVTVGISMAISIPGEFIGQDLAYFWSIFTSFLSLFVIAPLTVVWWTRLYMSRTGKALHDRQSWDARDEAFP